MFSSFCLSVHIGKANADNRSNQGNPNAGAYKSGADNRSNQMNPNHSSTKGSSKK